VSATPVQNELELQSSAPLSSLSPPASPSPLEGARTADRRFLVGCVAGVLIGVALALPVAYGWARIDAPKATATVATRAGAEASLDQLAVLLNTGLSALADKNPSQALALFQAADRAYPLNARVQNNICVALSELRRYAEAADHCKLALSLAPDLTLAERNLQWAESQLRKRSFPSAATAPASR
jgi:tetratricopeptide (TPR) repeat protein